MSVSEIQQIAKTATYSVTVTVTTEFSGFVGHFRSKLFQSQRDYLLSCRVVSCRVSSHLISQRNDSVSNLKKIN